MLFALSLSFSEGVKTQALYCDGLTGVKIHLYSQKMNEMKFKKRRKEKGQKISSFQTVMLLFIECKP